MALKAFGDVNQINIVANSARVTRKQNGLEEGECSFEVTGIPATAGEILQSFRPLGSSHPMKSYLYMETQILIYTPTGARLDCSYAGVTFEWLDRPTYELILGVQESPIETHPDFEDFAGSPSSPMNGALFVDPATGNITGDDARGIFDSFAPYLDGGGRNPKAGIEAFLDPVATYRESMVSYSLPNVSGFGQKVSDVPGPGFRGSLGNRNWLYTGFTYRRRGAPGGSPNQVIYEITKEWRLSGRAGWDADIYA